MDRQFTEWLYIPILAISPSELIGIEQLPDKDKDNLLPLFPLKGWMNAHTLEKAIKRIESAIGSRSWIADIDEKYLSENKTFLFTGAHPDKPIFKELLELLDPSNGFDNWYNFIAAHKPLIPCLRHESIEGIHEQIFKLSSLNRGLVIRILVNENNASKYQAILDAVRETRPQNTLLIYDLGDIDANFREELPLLVKFIEAAKSTLHPLTISISSTSFPSNFAGQLKGDHSIYERLLYNTISDSGIFQPLVYSDRGSARALKQDGGSGVPPPRIDYPLKKDWRFVRREVESDAPNSKENRKSAYIEIAKEIMNSNYWIPELRLWGTQQIEITADANDFGIFTPQKSTAARINIHLFNQLHYQEESGTVDTDEEWID